MFLARSGIIKDKSPREIFYETTREMFFDKITKAQLAEILPRKYKDTGNKMTARPILGLNDHNTVVLSRFIMEHLAESFEHGKLPNPPPLFV